VGEAKRIYQYRNGVARQTIFDGETLTIHTAMDVEAVLDSIARDREIFSHTGPTKVAARLPMIVVEDLQRRGIYDDEDAFKAWLNSIEAAPWRIWKGRL
jgi:hypothetical protein